MSTITHGIDVGGTKIELVSFDGELNELHRCRIDTPTSDITLLVEGVASLVEAADRMLGDRGLVGVGVPGFRDARTGGHVSANVPALRGHHLDRLLQVRLGRTVTAANDCHCFALSEANGGAAERFTTMFGLVIGTGAAGGYCVDGRLLAGSNGAAGEVGHTPISSDLLDKHQLPSFSCPCGKSGCAERYVSGSGLQAIFRHFSGLDLDGQGILDRVVQGDSDARRAQTVHLDILASSLANLILYLNPHAIVLGGGLSKLAYLYAELPSLLGQHLISGMLPPPILAPAFGDAGGTRGAAILARQSHQARRSEAC